MFAFMISVQSSRRNASAEFLLWFKGTFPLNALSIAPEIELSIGEKWFFVPFLKQFFLYKQTIIAGLTACLCASSKGRNEGKNRKKFWQRIWMDKKIEKTIQICINFKLLLAERRLTMKSRLRDAFEGVGLSNICYTDCKYSWSTWLGDFHPSGRMGKLL